MDTDTTIRLLETLVALAAAVSWPLLVLFLVLYFGAPLKKFLADMGEFGFKLGPGGIEATGKRPELRELRRVEPAAQPPVASAEERFPESVAQRISHRAGIYERNRNVFLAHSYEPSKTPGQKFDVFVYLLRHQSGDLADVDHAEFFLGRFWGNQIFNVANQGRLIGISTSAYGSFLATCRVVFKDGYEVMLDRYIDFEMSPLPKS